MYSKLLSLLCCLAITLSAWGKEPKYVFLFIGDGMGVGHVMAAQNYNRTVLNNEKPLTMLQFPVVSLATTYSASHPITYSAASGTAISTGTKTRNHMLGMDSDTISLFSVAKQLKEHGYGVAIASSVAIDDATPAAFYTHVDNRKKYYEIGKDLAASGYDMFAGAALRGTKDKNGKENDLIPTLEKSGYKIIHSENEYERNKGEKKILLLNKGNSSGHIGYTIDSLKEEHLTLPFITKACINHMQRVSPKKFFMMIEGGNIDWAAHSNDAGTVVKEILNFDQSIKIAYDFYLKHPDETLIIVTADHNTGGMSVGVKDAGTKTNYKVFDYQKMSLSAFSNYCDKLLMSGRTIEWDEMKQILKDNFGLYGPISLDEKQDKAIQDKFIKTFKQHNGAQEETLYQTFNEFVQQIFKTLDFKANVGWTNNYHCGDFVPVFVVGIGHEKFSPLNDNTDIANKIRKITDID